MTIDQAAEVLGVDPKTVEPDELSARYRTLANRYHPDTARHDGAAQQFKLLTPAFELLQSIARTPKSERVRRLDTVYQAANNFSFVVPVFREEVYLLMTDREHRLAAECLAIMPLCEQRARKSAPLLGRSFTGSESDAVVLLIAPVDVEVVDVRPEQDSYLMLLKPTEVDQVQKCLQAAVNAGRSLVEACEMLAADLAMAARVPLDPRSQAA